MNLHLVSNNVILCPGDVTINVLPVFIQLTNAFTYHQISIVVCRGITAHDLG